MSKTAAIAVKQLENAVTDAIKKAIENGALPQSEIPQFIIETPADRKNGDLATNAAMVGARAFKMPPFKIAGEIKNNLVLDNTFFTKCEIAGPGFINFFFAPSYYAGVLRDIENEGDSYGRSDFGKGKKVIVFKYKPKKNYRKKQGHRQPYTMVKIKAIG